MSTHNPDMFSVLSITREWISNHQSSLLEFAHQNGKPPPEAVVACESARVELLRTAQQWPPSSQCRQLLQRRRSAPCPSRARGCSRWGSHSTRGHCRCRRRGCRRASATRRSSRHSSRPRGSRAGERLRVRMCLRLCVNTLYIVYGYARVWYAMRGEKR